MSEKSHEKPSSPPKSPNATNESHAFSPVLVSTRAGSQTDVFAVSSKPVLPDTLDDLAEPKPMALPQLHGIKKLVDIPDPEVMSAASEKSQSEDVSPVNLVEPAVPPSPKEDDVFEAPSPTLSPQIPFSTSENLDDGLIPSPIRRTSISPTLLPSGVPKVPKLPQGLEAPGTDWSIEQVHKPRPRLRRDTIKSTSSSDLELRSTDLSSSPLHQSPINRQVRPRLSSMTDFGAMGSLLSSADPLKSPGPGSLNRMSTMRRLSSPEGGIIGKFTVAAPFLLQRRRSSVWSTGGKTTKRSARRKERAFEVPSLSSLGLDDASEELMLTGRTDLMKPDKLTSLAAALTVKRIRHMTLSQIALGQHGIEAMQPVFKNLLHLERLDAEHTQLHAFGATSLGQVLAATRGLRSLQIAHNDVGPKGLKALLHGIRYLSALEDLGVASNNIADEGLTRIAESLRATKHSESVGEDQADRRPLGASLTALNLADNGIGPEGCISLFGSMVGLDVVTQIRRLNLSDNPITNVGSEFSGVAALRDSLREMTSISSLNLTNTKLSTEGGIMVVEGLVTKEKQMQAQVRVFWRKIGNADLLLHERRALEKEAQEFEASFRKYSLERPLQELDLGANVLGMEGMRAIGEAKGLFACLTSLNIGSNEMTGNHYNPTFDGTVKLTDALKAAKNLTYLNVSDNRISTESGDETCLPTLCESLYLLQRLTYLDISTNNMGPKGAKIFAGSLASLRGLRYLDVSKNHIESQGMKDLVPALRGTLTDINLSNNDIGPDGVSALTKQLPSLTSITKLDLSNNRLSAAFGVVLDRDSSPPADDPVTSVNSMTMGPMNVNSRSGSPTRTPGSSGQRSRAPITQHKPRTHIGFRDVASKMSISHGEVRKLALMAQETEGGMKRGFTLFAQACGIHLINISEVVISVTIDAGTIRNKGPTLNLSSGRYGQEDVIIIGELLKQNPSLTAVDLSNNDLTKRGSDLRGMEVLAEWLQQANNVLELDLSFVNLMDGGAVRMAKGLTEVPQLETLKLKGNFLTSAGAMAMASAAASLSSLTHLDISQNPLGFVEKEADRWRVEESLETFSMALKNCIKLKIFDIRDCVLGDEGGRAIALALESLEELTHLNISGNDIQEKGQEDIGSAVRRCTKVEVTDDIFMPMPDEDGTMVWSLEGKIMAIYQVSLIANCIRRAQFVSLDLSNNNIGKHNDRMKDLADAFGSLHSLQDLNLSNNGPFSVEVCRLLSKSLQHMTTLRTLRLADNSIFGDGADAIMCTIVRLPKLRELDISHNRFKVFPVAVPASCPELVRIEVSGNPWLCPSETVMAKNTFQIRDHLSTLFNEGTRDRDIALALVGGQLVGKTSLLRALMSPHGTTPHIAVNERTKGVAFNHWQPSGKSGPNFTAYDFAGMMLYREIQTRVFLPRRALYLLVWRPFAPFASTDGEDSDVEHTEDATEYRVRSRGSVHRVHLRSLLAEQVNSWLADLYQRVPGCTVVLVGTHAGEKMPAEELSWQATQIENAARAKINHLNYEFQHLQPMKLLFGANGGAMPMVCNRTGAGIDKLRAHIIATATALPFYGEFLPRPWVLFRQYFLSQERKNAEGPGNRRDSAKAFGAATAEGRHRAMSVLSVQSDEGLNLFHGQPEQEGSLTDRHSPTGSSPDDPVGSPTLEEHKLDAHRLSLSQEAEASPLGRLKHEASMMSHVSQEGEGASGSLGSPLAAMQDKARGGQNQVVLKGYLWIGHLKRLAKDCGVEDCQIMELLRFMHDSCLLRFFAFDEGPDSWRQGNETHGGFEELEPYRSTGFKIATNSRQGLMNKKPPSGIREQAWGNMLDTVIVDVPWLARLITSIIDTSPREALAQIKGRSAEDSADISELQEAAWALHKEASLRWTQHRGYDILREMWSPFMPDHDMRRMRNVFEGKNLLQFRDGRMFVPALRKREGTPSTAGQSAVFLSSDRNPSVVNNKENNMARPWSRLFTTLLQDIVQLQVRSTNRGDPEENVRETVASCGVFVMVVTEPYFHNRMCLHELTLALELAMPIIPIILPQYSLWPPQQKDGCWWEDLGLPHMDDLFLSDPIDLSLAQFQSLLDTLLETAPLVESRTPSLAGSDDGDRRWSMLDEPPSKERWGMMDLSGDGPTPPSSRGGDGFTPPSTRGPRSGAQTPKSGGQKSGTPKSGMRSVGLGKQFRIDHVPTVHELLIEMKQRMEARMEEPRFDESTVVHTLSIVEDEGDAAQAELDAAYDELCQVVERALTALVAATHQNTWFPIAREQDEVDLHYRQSLKVRQAYESAQRRAIESEEKKHADAVRRENERHEREEEARRQGRDELAAHRVNAELWQRDPLHAKIAILHSVANIHRGLGVAPRWQDKEEIVAKAQQMANDPSMFEMTDASEALSAAIDHAREFGAVARRTNSGGDAMDEEMGDREISPRRQLEEIHAGGAEAEVSEEEPLVDGDEAEEKEKEEEEEEEPEGREPLFDMMLSTKIGGSIRFERTASAGEDEEDMPDFTLTLGLEQHFGSVPPTPGQESAPQTPAAHVPVPEIPTQAVVPPSPTSMGVAAEPSSSPVATSAESPEAEPSEATPEESKPVQPAEPQLTFEEKRALAREKGKQKAREREAAKLKEQQAEQPDEADEAETGEVEKSD